MNLAEALDYYVRPHTFPLAIKLLKATDEIPADARRPLKDLGFKSAICQAIGIARRTGWKIALTEEDMSCPFSLIVFGLAKSVSFYEEGRACLGMYTESPEAARRSEAETPKLEYNQYRGVIVSPIFKSAEMQPDLYLVFGNSAQTMRLAAAALYKRGGRIESSSSARIDCADEIIQTQLSREYHYVLPCYGDRMFGLTSDDEMVFSIPCEKADEIVEGLQATHKNGIRYPIPVFMRHEVQLPEQYNKLMDLLKGQ